MQQFTTRGITLFDASFNGRYKHKAIAANDDPWGFKIQQGRSFVGSGEDVPFYTEQLKPFNSEIENVYNS